MSDQAVMKPGQRSAQRHSVALDLHDRFQGVFGIETIEALPWSFDELSKTATVTRWLVLSARRFAEKAQGPDPCPGPLRQGPRGAVPVRA